MIKVLTGFSGPGGSTVAFNNLVNLFNQNGMRACLYGSYKWDGIDCKFEHINTLSFDKSDVLIYHFLNIKDRPNVKKLILSSHETNIFPIKENKDLVYDRVHFVSDFQKNWQGIDGTVIPNVIKKYIKSNYRADKKIAGIIGSIDEHKRVHLSIERALKDKDVDKVELWGAVTEPKYFLLDVVPLLGERVSYHGISNDMQKVYDRIDVVYASSKRECLPMIQGECRLMGMDYRGLPENTRSNSDYEFDNNKILNMWKKLIYEN